MSVPGSLLKIFRFAKTLLVSVLPMLLVGAPYAYSQTAGEMACSAAEFLEALSAEQRSSASFAYDNDERLRWHFIPNEMHPRSGVTIKALDSSQRELAHKLLMTGLSQRGYMTYSDILILEQILQDLGQDNFARDPEEYYLTIFGNPQTADTWSWRFEGHHISVHCNIVEGRITVSTPTFFGANPAVVRSGPNQGLRTLGVTEDSGRALALALDAAQQSKMMISDVAPRDIITGNNYPIDPLSPIGITASELSSAQQQLLRTLIQVYSAKMVESIATQRWLKIEQDGFENISFAWAGSLEVGQPHYYRVQGPSFLIEYDNTQNDANHIHSVWRDFNEDFGRDLLREHHAASDHQH